MEAKDILSQTLRGYRSAARAAKVFQVMHGVALGSAAAALVVGGVRAVRKLRGDGE